MLKFVNQLCKNELSGKKVLLRVDFNVPIKDNRIEDSLKIKAHQQTIDYLLQNGADILLVSHIDAIDSFNFLVEQISMSIGQTLTLVSFSQLNSLRDFFQKCPVLLLDNIRQNPGEIENDEEFARNLSKSFDYYVNDAFAVMHRKHASVSAITRYLPSYAGFLVKRETNELANIMNSPADGKIFVIGGAKISTKLPVIKNFLNKADKILIGGAIANNFFKANGISVGSSLVDDKIFPDVQSEKILLPEDILVTQDKSGKTDTRSLPVQNIEEDEYIIDIGPKTAKKFAEIISQAKTVIWNGPMGLFEIEKFGAGTKSVAEAIVSVKHSVIGGGDTISALDKLVLLDKVSFVSTGGGAMLEFLAGDELPGLKVLGYYE